MSHTNNNNFDRKALAVVRTLEVQSRSPRAFQRCGLLGCQSECIQRGLPVRLSRLHHLQGHRTRPWRDWTTTAPSQTRRCCSGETAREKIVLGRRSLKPFFEKRVEKKRKEGKKEKKGMAKFTLFVGLFFYCIFIVLNVVVMSQTNYRPMVLEMKS